MAKTIPSQRSVYIAAAIVIVVTALWAVLFVPRLDMHPEAIKDGAADSSRMFFKTCWRQRLSYWYVSF